MLKRRINTVMSFRSRTPPAAILEVRDTAKIEGVRGFSYEYCWSELEWLEIVS